MTGYSSFREKDPPLPAPCPDDLDRDCRREAEAEADRAAAPDPLPPLPALDSHLYAIHYSQELQANCAAHTPPVSAISVQHVLTGQQQTFAAFRIVEQRGITPATLPAHLADLETHLLKEFFEFVARNPDAVWLHWAMRQPRFGFEVLSQRARLHGLAPAEIPLSQRFDLSSYLKRRFGDDYVPHPRFLNALERNGMLGPGLLDEQAAAAAWARGEFATLLQSLACKVDRIADLFERVQAGTFRTGAAGAGVSLACPSPAETRGGAAGPALLPAPGQADRRPLNGTERRTWSHDSPRCFAMRSPLCALRRQ
jgi:hypothetical protein